MRRPHVQYGYQQLPLLPGLLCPNDWRGVDYFPDPAVGAKEFLEMIHEHFEIIIHTCRCTAGINGKEASHLLVNRVRDWLNSHGLVYDHIWSEPGKPIAHWYVDDRSVIINSTMLVCITEDMVRRWADMTNRKAKVDQ